jgi:hypothetical protein
MAGTNLTEIVPSVREVVTDAAAVVIEAVVLVQADVSIPIARSYFIPKLTRVVAPASLRCRSVRLGSIGIEILDF